VFSATSDFGEVKKSNGFYARVCEIADVKPHEVVHIGDHWVFDFVNPREMGMTAYFLDRGRSRNRKVEGEGRKSGVKVKREDEFVISDLNEIIDVFVR
jgi:putative hydrolase of the HAD superfamily